MELPVGSKKMTDLVEAGGHALKMDVEDENSIHAGIEAVMQKEGRVDVLINNAGFGLYGSVEDTGMDDARRQFGVCLFGMGALTKAVIPIMRNQGSGKIINISSMVGWFVSFPPSFLQAICKIAAQKCSHLCYRLERCTFL
jgi:NAD(P)-dependent dehydrogenase (short-subunit alcohol dehydrogenase family)